MRLMLGLIVAVGLTGCAASQHIALEAAPGQEQIVRNGFPTLVSKRDHLVMLRPNSRKVDSTSRPAFTVAVRNLGKDPVLLSEDQISVWVGSDKKASMIPIVRHSQLETEHQQRQAMLVLAAAIGGAGRAMSAANAGYSNTTGSFNAPGYGGTFSAQTYDAGAAYAAQAHAQAQTAADFAAIKADGERNIEILERQILKDHTVMPGEWYGGTIILNVPPKDEAGSAKYKIAVRFGHETHEFSVAQKSP